MKILTVLNVIRDFFNDNILPVYKVPSIISKNEGWEVIVELIEEKDYMISHAKEELIGVYKVFLNNELEILSYERLNTRSRGAVIK